MLRLLVSAGGTGGGVYPALAVLSELAERAEVLWVGGQGGMEAALVRRAGLPFESIPAAGLHGVGISAIPGNLARLAAGIPAARQLLKKFDPQVLFFTGGYVGVPMAIAGRARPQLTFVPDVEPGLALRLINLFADLVTVSTEGAKQLYSDRKRVLATGYPVRPALKPTSKEAARERLGLEKDRATLLVFGGSRGARSINEALWSSLALLLERIQIVHITGELDWRRVSSVEAELSGEISSRYIPKPYLHEAMGDALSASDLVVSRAGAATMGEYPRFGLPAILVPYPHAWRYQRVNAEYLERAGGALVLMDENLDLELADVVLGLIHDQSRLDEMSSAMRVLERPDAAERIAQAILELAGARSGSNG